MTNPTEGVRTGYASGGAVPSAEEVNRIHRYSDKDVSEESLHHTLGNGSLQAAAGDHSHDGRNSLDLSGRYATADHTHDFELEPTLPDHTHPGDPTLPRGYVGEAAQGGPIFMPAINTNYEVEQTRVTIPEKPTARRYKLTFGALFGLGTGGTFGLYNLNLRQQLFQTVAIRTTDRQVYINQVGGSGQQSLDTFLTAVVPANTQAIWSVMGFREAGGTSTDAILEARLLVEDIGAP